MNKNVLQQLGFRRVRSTARPDDNRETMKPLLHETGEVPMGIESVFLEANEVSTKIEK
ncbi:hypothetical protein SAMN04487988_11714 [Algoriphagus hitonicola]|uniref:Uncharacterized protein n=1 Tax=Algoriphagus hitonicola TaxID=435880 RepID=A0A1I2X8I9_9BACT|nr:hypothetical protein SAMN04487988_11714 [Algoriphagus hitonicola]